MNDNGMLQENPPPDGARSGASPIASAHDLAPGLANIAHNIRAIISGAFQIGAASLMRLASRTKLVSPNSEIRDPSLLP